MYKINRSGLNDQILALGTWKVLKRGQHQAFKELLGLTGLYIYKKTSRDSPRESGMHLQWEGPFHDKNSHKLYEKEKESWKA